MATRYTSLDKIHRIIFHAPDDSDDSIQSWEEDSDKEISDLDDTEDVQNQDLQSDFGNEGCLRLLKFGSHTKSKWKVKNMPNSSRN